MENDDEEIEEGGEPEVIEVETPEPGIYADVEDKYYRAWKAVSITTAFYCTISPGHYRHRLMNPPAETAPMRLGTNFHTKLLQPTVWNERSVVMPDYAAGLCDEKGKPYKAPKSSKKYKELVKVFKLRNEGKIVLDKATNDKLDAMVARVHEKDCARSLITGDGDAELSILAKDPETGILCKGRLDKYDEVEESLIDLKTVGTYASPIEFAKTVADRGYYIQMAHYIEIAALCDMPIRQVTFIGVETKPPYGCATYELPQKAIEAGKWHRRMLLETLDRCHKLNDWPLYEDEIRPLNFNSWSFRFVEESLE